MHYELYLNGEKYTKGSFNTSIKLVSDIFIPDKAKDPKIVFGFTDRQSFIEWAANEGPRTRIEETIKRIEDYQNKYINITEYQTQQLENVQADQAKKERIRIFDSLKEYDLLDPLGRFAIPLKIIELAKQGLFNCIFLYDKKSFGLPFLFLPSGGWPNLCWLGSKTQSESGTSMSSPWLPTEAGNYWSPMWHPISRLYRYGGIWYSMTPIEYYSNKYWFNWNDRVESAINLTPFWIPICEQAWFKGIWYWMRPFECDPDFGWFRNRASSTWA